MDLTEIYKLLSLDSHKTLVQLIEERLDDLGVSQRQVSDALGIQRRSLQRLLEGEAQKIDLLTVLKISQFLNISINEISQLYVSGLSSHSIGDLERARKAGFIMRHFDLDVLKKIGFISDTTDFEAIEKRIKDFFKLNSVEEYENEVAYSLFSKTKNRSDDRMVKFWISTAYNRCLEIDNPNHFDREAFLQIIPRLRSLTCDEDKGLAKAAHLLSKVGVTVIVLGYVSKIQVRGATFLVNGKPCIVISDFNKRLDTMWFTLMHEIYHVLKDLDTIRTIGYHLSKEENDQLVVDLVNEDLANAFASEYLISSDKVKFIKSFIGVESIVDSYATKWQVHPAIVYGAYLRKYPEDYSKYKKRIANPEKLIQGFFAYPWSKEPTENQDITFEKEHYSN